MLDSTKYISLSNQHEPFTATTTVGGFVATDGTITNKTTLGVKFDIELGQCQALFNSETGGDLYFTFALCFADRMESDLFDVENFEAKVTIGGTPIGTTATDVIVESMVSTGVTATIKSFKAEGETEFATEAKTSSTYVFVMQLHFPGSNEGNYKYIASNISAELAIDYTLTPQSAEHYRALMDAVFGDTGKSKSLMSDVRITDYQPFVME